MGQKLLLFISIFVLNSVSALADSEGVPPLPESVIEIEDDSSAPEDKSFFEKTKSFFGFGKEESSKDEKAVDEVASEIAAKPIESDPIEKPLELPSQDAIKEMNKNAPASATEEGPLATSIKTTNVPDDSVADEALKLPEGFEDYAKSTEDEAETANVEAPELDAAIPVAPEASSPDMTEAPAPAPETPELPEVPEVKPESPLELPQSEAPKLPASDPTNPVADIEGSAPEKEDIDVPELPVIPSFDDAPEAEQNTEALPIMDKTESTTEGEEKAPSSDEVKLGLPKQADTDGIKTEEPVSEPVKKEELSADSKDKKAALPTPSYANKASVEEGEPAVLKYQQQQEAKYENEEVLPQISKEELVIGEDVKIKKFSAVRSAELSPEQAKFVDNEAQVLILPNDDIVLGSLTEEARLENMDLRSYLTVFWKNYNKIKREPKRMEIDRFIDEYDENFNEEDSLYSNDQSEASLNEAFKAIDKREIYSLIGFVNNYPIIHLPGAGDNNLLHEAAYVGNYPAAKFLVLKGIDLFAKNDSGNSALAVSKMFGQKHITSLLKSAGAK